MLPRTRNSHERYKNWDSRTDRPGARIQLAAGDNEYFIPAPVLGELPMYPGPSIAEVHCNKAKWLLDDSRFRNWLDSGDGSGNGVLWIHGVPGAGKTQQIRLLHQVSNFHVLQSLESIFVSLTM